MSLPLTTTTIEVERATAPVPYEPKTLTTVASGVVGHIGQPAGIERRDLGGRSAEIVAVAYVPASTDVELGDVVTSALGVRYDVGWVDEREGLGLAHLKLGLTRHVGAPSR